MLILGQYQSTDRMKATKSELFSARIKQDKLHVVTFYLLCRKTH